MIKDGKFKDTLDRGGDGNMFYSSSGFDRYHGHRRYHHYRGNDRGYLSDGFKK